MFDVHDDGTLSSGRIFASLAGKEDGIPDGMKVDTEGHVYCTGPGGIWVLGQHRNLLRTNSNTGSCLKYGMGRGRLADVVYYWAELRVSHASQHFWHSGSRDNGRKLEIRPGFRALWQPPG